MTEEELTALWTRFKIRDEVGLRQTLIDHYYYLVRITANRIGQNVPAMLEREDLVSAGTIGLIHAVDQFDLARKVQFKTYAIALIRGQILELLRGEDWAPRSVRDRIRQLDRGLTALEMKLGRPATEQELALALDLDAEELHRTQNESWQMAVLSMDDPLSNDGDRNLRRSDLVESPERDTETLAQNQEERFVLGEAVANIPNRERLVLSLYYFEGLTFREIGAVLQVSESRIFQLHQQAMNRLRCLLKGQITLFKD